MSINIQDSKLEGSNVASPGAKTENQIGVKLNKYWLMVLMVVILVEVVLMFRSSIEASNCVTLKLFGGNEINWCKE